MIFVQCLVGKQWDKVLMQDVSGSKGELCYHCLGLVLLGMVLKEIRTEHLYMNLISK